MQSEINSLLQIIEGQLGWGGGSAWKSRDFEMLNQLIFDKTKISLSASTLRRIWGRVEYHHLPSVTTLDALSVFAGFESWRAFLKTGMPQQKAENPETPLPVKPKSGNKSLLQMATGVLVIASICISGIYLLSKSSKHIDPENYSFSSQRLAKGVPNSVIFNYDATASPTDSVYIQQTWDPRTKTLVRKDLHQFTSVYYEPGFYQAKLVVGGKTVKQHKLMIPTSGWLGLIENKPIPYYLNLSDFVFKREMHYNLAPQSATNINMPIQAPQVKYYNVGNFAPVPLSGFSFNALVKNEYGAGAAACQFAGVSLITDSGPIIIPLSAKGCVSDLEMISVDWIISGKVNNLSGFGVDFSDWVKVSCKNSGNKIQYYINNKLAYESPMPSYNVNIVGVGFRFQGTGSVKKIELKSGDKTAYNAF